LRYFSEKEKIQNERWVKNYPKFLQSSYRKTKTVHDYYDEELAPLINKRTVLLDAGCGKKGIMDKYNGRTRFTVGIDLRLEALKVNNSMDYSLKSNVEKLPFRNGSFNVVICQWVGEHLRKPKMVYKEFARVLKENGHLIIVTNSVYSPIMLASAILPSGFRDKAKEKVFPSEIKEDTFPTYYKCNCKKRCEKVLSDLGLSKNFSGYAGDISLFLFSKILFVLILLYEKITDLKRLNFLKLHILVHYKKQFPE